MEGCIFCKIVKGEVKVDVLYEDELALAFADVAPIAPVHILIIPKKHIENIAHLPKSEKDERMMGRLISIARDLAEKKLGLAAKERLKELCGGKLKVKSLGKGKYGRILGIPYTEDGKDICEILIKEGHAVEYHGGTKVKVWGNY